MDIQSQSALQGYDHLTERNRELRKTNVKLLEEKRDLLVQVQQGHRARGQVACLSEMCEDLKNKVEILEKERYNKVFDKDQQLPPPTMRGIDRALDETPGNPQDEPTQCFCESAKKLEETIVLNHQWNDAYKRSLDRYRELEKKFYKQEEDLEMQNEESKVLRELVQKLESDVTKSEATGYRRSISREMFCSNDDIEALKLQLLAYQEDFGCEKEEREKSEKKAKTLEKQLKDTIAVNQSLSNEVVQFQDYLTKMSAEKQHVLGELRRLSTSNYFTPAPELFHLPVRRNSSYPLNANDAYTLAMSAAQTRRSDPDFFRGGNVVKDSMPRIPSR